ENLAPLAAVGRLDLTLSALHSIINAGTISSSGNLSLNAGGAITNQGLMQAGGNVNLMSAVGSITNMGIISSLVGNVNVNATFTQNLIVNNIAGIIEAKLGSINLRDDDYLGKESLQFTGGELLANELNINAGEGNARLSVGNLEGTLNARAGFLNAFAPAKNLVLGDLVVTGDPVIVNPSGPVSLSSSQPFVGNALIAAQTNITGPAGTSGFTLSANSSSGTGANLTLVAGANITQQGGATTINGPSGTGGNIDFANLGQNFLLSTAATNTNGSGGDLTLIAFKGTSDTGKILLPNTPLSR